MNQNITVLIVDDDEQFNLLVSKIVHALGGSPVQARTAEQALQIFDCTRPEIVVVDVVMPGIDGLELTKRILSRDPLALVAIVTGEPTESLVTEALKAGAVDFLKKPLHADELRTMLSRLHRIHRRRREKIFTPEQLDDARVELSLSSSRNSIAPAVYMLREMLRGFVSNEELVRLDLAFQEMITNAYEHGSCSLTYEEKMRLCESGTLDQELERRGESARAAGKKILVSAAIADGCFKCTVTDEGEGFDWAALPDPIASPESLSSLHGRGLLIIKRTFDGVHFNGKGNSISVTKRL